LRVFCFTEAELLPANRALDALTQFDWPLGYIFWHEICRYRVIFPAANDFFAGRHGGA
jgi:hypothetical protein